MEQRPIPQQAKNEIDSHMPEFVGADREFKDRDCWNGGQYKDCQHPDEDRNLVPQ